MRGFGLVDCENSSRPNPGIVDLDFAGKAIAIIAIQPQAQTLHRSD